MTEQVKRSRGRPVGSKAKINAQRDIANAFASGMSLRDIVDLLSKKIESDKVTDAQKTKYLDQLINLKLQLIKLEPKQKGQSGKSNSSEDRPKATTYQFKAS